MLSMLRLKLGLGNHDRMGAPGEIYSRNASGSRRSNIVAMVIGMTESLEYSPVSCQPSDYARVWGPQK
jgi:hypothetical protein